MSQPGWISVHRKIRECEIWLDNEPFDKRSAWIDLLLLANYETKSAAIGAETVVVERGSFVTSQPRLAERWHWGRQKVRSYLKLLVNLNMITLTPTNKFTIIKVLKYDVFQLSSTLEQPTNNQQKTNKQPTDNQQITTTNNINNNNNVNNNILLPPDNTNYISKGVEEYNLFKDVETTLMIPLTPKLAEMFLDLFNEVGEGAFRQALIEAVKYNGRSYAYVEKVARRIASGTDVKAGTGTIDWDSIRAKLKEQINEDHD